MKKLLFFIFGSFLFYTNTNAQAQLKEFYFTCDQYIPSLVQDSIIDNAMNGVLDLGNKSNQIFISKSRTPNYAPLNIVLMHFNMFDVNDQLITHFSSNRFQVQLDVFDNSGIKMHSQFFLSEESYQCDLFHFVQNSKNLRVRVIVTDMDYSVTYSPKPPYDINVGFPILEKFIIYNPLPEKRFICNTATSNIYGFNDMNTAASSIYRDGQQKISFQWTSSTGGVFTDISGATNSTLEVSSVNVKTYYNREVIYTTSAGVSTTYFSADTLLTLTPAICGVFSSSISGPASVAPHQTSIYTVDENVDLEYVWTVWGGDIVSGQGTNSITVLWGEYYAPHILGRTNGVTLKETDRDYISKYTFQDVTITSTGINIGLDATGISVFPNPIKNEFTIEMPITNTDVNYTLYSTTGVQMQSGSFSATASGNTISTQVPAGMYQLVLSYDGVFTSTRLAVVE